MDIRTTCSGGTTIVRFADRVLMMTDGELVEDLRHPTATVIAEKLSELS